MFSTHSIPSAREQAEVIDEYIWAGNALRVGWLGPSILRTGQTSTPAHLELSPSLPQLGKWRLITTLYLYTSYSVNDGIRRVLAFFNVVLLYITCPWYPYIACPCYPYILA